jgi:hypothetical protein
MAARSESAHRFNTYRLGTTELFRESGKMMKACVFYGNEYDL